MDAVGVDDEVYDLKVLLLEYLLTDLPQLNFKLVWLSLVVLLLVNLLILHEHQCDRQVQNEE